MSLPTPRGVLFSTKAAFALAVVSVAAAVWLSLQPHRLHDLEHLTTWVVQWSQGTDIYRALPDVDYPPWAIVTLSPLAWLPPGLVAPVWVATNLLALTYVALALARTKHRSAFGSSAVELAALLAAAGAMRTLNQFSLVALAFAVAGITTRGPLGPVWLGLSLMKPQIGGVLWLGALWKGQWRLAGAALVVPFALALVYSAHAGVGPTDGLIGWADALRRQHQDLFYGQTDFGWIVRGWYPGISPILISVGIAVVVFLPLARTRADLGFALASLASVRHLSYDLVLLVPFLPGLERGWLWATALLMALDPAGVSQVLVPGSWMAAHGDRLTLGLAWAGLITFELGRFRRQSMTK